MDKDHSARMRCPVCRQPATREERPFCSTRCREIDLGRWMKGSYAIAGDPVTDGDVGEEGGD